MKENIEDSIAKALAGESSTEEMSALDAWRTDSAENEHAYHEFVKAWEAAQEASVFMPDTNAAWERMQARLKDETPVVSIAPEPTPAVETAGSKFGWMKVAAVAAVLLVGTLVATYVMSGDGMTQVAVVDEMKEVQLPDGSTVWLNYNSTLSYPETFAEDQRVVELSGEAFFEVTKNPSKPFIIKTSHTETKVLGTSFNLRAYDGEEATSVTVTTGKVSFANLAQSAEPVILTPGEVGTFDVDDKELSKEQNQEPNYNAWRTRELSFNATTFGDAEKILENCYGVQIEFENEEIRNCPTNGTFNGETLDSVLNVLTVSNECTFVGEGKVYTIKGAGCPAH